MWRVIFLALILASFVPARATILYESAILGTTGHNTGFSISATQWLATRFSLTETAQVTAVGGHIGNFLNQALFAAIIPLDPTTGLPLFNPDQTEAFALAGTSFIPQRLSAEVTVPLSVQLLPGDYALIFGAGAFGSPVTGQGFFPCIGSCGPSNPDSFVDTDLPGASYFRGVGIPTQRVFVDDGFNNTRFFVLGEDVDIDIDIKPGGDPNSWPCKKQNDTLPVAILSTDSFDARSVDADSVRFGAIGTEAAEVHEDNDGNAKRHVEDVNKDGRPDMVFHFRFGDTGFSCNDIHDGEKSATVTAVLTGETVDRTPVEGGDFLRLVRE